MRYFTPDLIARVASQDDDVADAADAEWDRAIVRCNRRWQKIKSTFPAAVRRFEEQRVCLHDAQMLSIGRRSNKFVMVLQMEPPSQNLVILTFTLDGEPVIDMEALPHEKRGSRAYWLYEEWDLDTEKKCCFEVLLSNGCSVKLRFRDFQFLIAQKVAPTRNGQKAPKERPRVARSAPTASEIANT